MLRGRFDNTTGRPFIDGYILFPRFRISSEVSFLVDTGSDSSMLHPLDGFSMGLDYSKLSGTVKSTGIGGVVNNYQEQAVVIFNEGVVRYYSYEVRLSIALPTESTMSLPSLLGRDILDRWYMMYNPSKNALRFKVISSDRTVRFP